MDIRRIVTGHDAQGQSVFVSDTATPRSAVFKSIPGQACAQVWATPSGASLPHREGDPTLARGSLVPGPGGTSLLIVSLPPDTVMADPALDPAVVGAELGAALPGLIESFEPGHPGMHTTDTVDYVIVLDGELWLELDQGAEKRLQTGDVVIQNGTRHAWRNKTDKPSRVAFVLIGAQRAGVGG
jgi:quercetin dioxygenase-like cupin family protein